MVMKASADSPKHLNECTADSLPGLQYEGLAELDAEGGLQALPFHSLQSIANLTGLPVREFYHALGLTLQGISDCRERGELNRNESQQLVSLARALSCTIRYFSGDTEKAIRWFTTPSPALGNIAPLQTANSRSGCQEVEALIGRLEHGVFS
jgi:putative toxin-antitoxin system antitoxin component (TIGR02293 family)